MTHTFIAFDVARTQLIIIPCENFGFRVEGIDSPDWITGVCLAGGEFEAMAEMLWLLHNPQPEMDEDDYEPEYTLAGGWAAYDA